MNRDMNHLDPAFDPRIADWLEGDPSKAPAFVLETVLGALPSVTQRRSRMVAWGRPSRDLRWLSLTLFVALALVIGGLLTIRGSTQPLVGGPAPVNNVRPAIPSSWTSDGGVVLTIRRDPAFDDATFWRASTWDVIRSDHWEQSDVRTVTRRANRPLLEGTIEDPGTAQGLREVTFSVTAVPGQDPVLVAPATPVRVGKDVRLTLIGEAGFFGEIRPDRPRTDEYEITARIPVGGTGEGGLSPAVLRAAGETYPDAVKERYMDVAGDIMGPNAARLRQGIEANAVSHAPFDLAEATEAELRSSTYTYDTNVSELDCQGISIVECFAIYKRGYCQHFSTTMAVLLRTMGVPTRIAEGYLPGERLGQTETIRASDAFTWVEVYFPNHGWVPFDPTGGPDRPGILPVALPSGG
jgi:transglutaminase-like putative cysteine protease